MPPEQVHNDVAHGRPFTSGATAERPRSTTMQPLILAGVIFVAALFVILLLISTRDDDPVELNASLLTLELAYPVSGEPTATLNGQPTAAPPNAPVSCRAMSDKRSLGEGEARDDGSVQLLLDNSLWPLESLTGDAWKSLNNTLECRAGTGPWVQPLRQPRIAIN